jgi:hypothetical protein
LTFQLPFLNFQGETLFIELFHADLMRVVWCVAFERQSMFFTMIIESLGMTVNFFRQLAGGTFN